MSINALLVGMPFINGKWDVSWLNNQVGYLQGTAFPTLSGNTIITAHVYDYDGSPGLFIDLYKLQYADEVFLKAWGQTYIYSVKSNQLVKPNDLSVLRHEKLDWLTLLTCQGYDANRQEYRYRRVVRAVLMSVIPDQ